MTKARKGVAGVLFQVTNRDIWEAYDSIQLLVSRGWSEASVALALGRSNRRLRDKKDEIDQARQMLLKEHGTVEPNGNVVLKDQLAFTEEWKKLLDSPAEIELFPIALTAVVARVKACETCKRGQIDDIAAGHLETLVFIGVIKEDGAAEA